MIRNSIHFFYRSVRRLLAPEYQKEEISTLLRTADPASALPEKIDWLEQLMFWITTSGLNESELNTKFENIHTARIRFILGLLEINVEWKKNVAGVLRDFSLGTSARSLFSEMGLGTQKGFLFHTKELAISALLPKRYDVFELSDVFLRIFKSKADADWVKELPADLISEIVDVIHFGNAKAGDVFERWRHDAHDALFVLGARVGALATQTEIIERAGQVELETYPFLSLSSLIHQYMNGGEGESNLAKSYKTEIRACHKKIEEVYQALQETGVSVAIVYSLESLAGALRRIELLCEFLLPIPKKQNSVVKELLSSLVYERLAQSTFRDLVRTNLHLISSKIVERTGASGEHYIARSTKEYYAMLRHGIGGGCLMLVTTLLKFSLGAIAFPLFFQGFFYSVNYSISFVVLQLCGFTLATKQPSATAAALAVKLREMEDGTDSKQFVDEVCRMTRTQFAALIGNLMLLIPLSVLLDLGCYYMWGTHFISAATAQYTYESLHPFKSLTIPAAFLTGIFLWTSSVIAGWFENWVVFRQIPDALRTHRRLVKVFGREGAKKVGDWTLRSATLLGGNVSLGLMLGFAPVVGKITGLPIDIRHVTLSSASLTFATTALVTTNDYRWELLVAPFFGVICIGILNFTVGYFLAFAVAVRARQVKPETLTRLYKEVRKRALRHPSHFFFPK